MGNYALRIAGSGIVLLAVAACVRAELAVQDPFLTDISRAHFAQCFPEVSKQDLDRLKNVARYGYLEFPPATPCTTPGCNSKLTEFTATRMIRFRASQLNPSVIRRTVYSMEGGDCSYNRVMAFSTTVTRDSIDYFYIPYHKERACNYGLKFDKGEAWADVHTTVTLNEDLSASTSTAVTNKQSRSNFSFGNAFSDAMLGGLLLGSVGAFIGAVGVHNIAPLFGFGTVNTEALNVDFKATGVDLYAYSAVQKKLDKLGHTTPLGPYVTRRDVSGFTLSGDEVSVEVLQSAQVLDLVRSDFADARKLEIDFLRALNEIEAKPYRVIQGDNLWSIARKEYLDARLFMVIAKTNRLKDVSRLRPGMILALPRWHELCKQFGGNPEAVLKGESLWLKASKGQIPRDLGRVKTYSGKKALVYPLEILDVSDPRAMPQKP